MRRRLILFARWVVKLNAAAHKVQQSVTSIYQAVTDRYDVARIDSRSLHQRFISFIIATE